MNFLCKLLIWAILCTFLAAGAKAHEAHQPHAQWFKSQKMNPATKERLGVAYQSCCDAGDHFPTRFRIIKDGSPYGADGYQYLLNGKWKDIPPDIVQRGKTPDGRPVLFRSPHSGTEYCFILDEEGI
jgi:hypothetical protein